MTDVVKQLSPYGLTVAVALNYEAAVEKVREELAKEGFGVLCDIDIKATLKKKLDVDFKRYVILGACNPPLAHKALSAEAQLGLLLPCNVVVYENDEGEGSVVSAIDPVVQLGITGNDALTPLAEEVRGRLVSVLEGVAS